MHVYVPSFLPVQFEVIPRAALDRHVAGIPPIRVDFTSTIGDAEALPECHRVETDTIGSQRSPAWPVLSISS